MIFNKTKIEGLYVIEPELKTDERGYFTRNFCKKELEKQKIFFNVLQINRSLTKEKGSFRGFHFQGSPKSEDKIVQCLEGAIFDVAIDLRENSLTFGQWVGQELTAENKKMLLIPKGFAHGFQSLKDNSEIQYFVSEFYSPEYERGIRWDDPFFKVKLPLKPTTISEKDKNWPLWKTPQK